MSLTDYLRRREQVTGILEVAGAYIYVFELRKIVGLQENTRSFDLCAAICIYVLLVSFFEMSSGQSLRFLETIHEVINSPHPVDEKVQIGSVVQNLGVRGIYFHG